MGGAGRWYGRTWVRVSAAVVLAAMLVAPLATVGYWSVADRNAHRRITDTERSGVAYLRPLTGLLAVLVAGESAAVRGEPVNRDAIAAATFKVATANGAYGRLLQTDERWATLQARIGALTGEQAPRGEAAYRQWSDVVGLTSALATRVGDTSNLVLDSDFDSYYLVDAGLLRLPVVIAGSGQLADLAAIAGPRSGGADAVRIAVLRDRVATAAAAVTGGLAKAVDATASQRVGTALLGPLDQFGAAVDALAPSVDVLAAPPLPANVPAAAFGVRSAALALADSVWAELDRLLAARVSDLDRDRLDTLLACGAGLLVALLTAALATRRRRLSAVLGGVDDAPQDPSGQSGQASADAAGPRAGDRARVPATAGAS